jgi:hypothetical protein
MVVPRSFTSEYGSRTFDLRSCLFWELIRVVQHLQQSHMHPCAYLLENVPPLGDSRPIVLVGWQEIKAWISKPM